MLSRERRPSPLAAGGFARRAALPLLVAGLAGGFTLAIAALPAAAKTAATESLRGQIIAPAVSGHRHVAASVIVMTGAVTGVGKIVEIPNRPGDPESVSRDDLVFPSGTLQIRNASQPPKISFDPKTCAIRATIEQTTTVEGGTRAFRDASGTFTGTVRAWGVAPRTAGGSCNSHADPVLDADAISARGALSP
jgi:hypothetical protein